MDKQENPYAFLENAGRIGRRIGQLDWSQHPLGAIDTWDAALRTSLGIVLASPRPTFLVWGADLTLFFNDPYEPLLDPKAHSLGSPYQAVWHEVWDGLGPYIARVLGGESFFFENYATTLERHGYPAVAWFTFSYSPLRDAAGVVRGLICTCVDVTGEKAGERLALHDGRIEAQTGAEAANAIAGGRRLLAPTTSPAMREASSERPAAPNDS